MAADHPQRYSSEAVQAILAEAGARQAADSFSRDQLLEMAAEMDIAPDLLDQVAADWQRRQQQRARQNTCRRRLRGQVIAYAVVNSGLVLLNLASAGTLTWALYPLLGWGLGLWVGGCGRSRRQTPAA